MKKLALSLFTFSMLVNAAEARSMAEIAKSGVLRIATNAEYEPFEFMKDGQITGFEVDLGNEIAARLKLKAEWVNLPFASLLDDVNKKPNEIDMVMASHAINSTRLKQVNFSNPHICTGSAILTHVGGPKTSKDLKPLRVGAELGSVNWKYLSKLNLDNRPVSFASAELAIKGLIDGKIDATVDDEIVAAQAVQANPNAKLEVSPSLWRSPAGMVFAKSSQSDELRRAVNKVLKEIVSDGTYKKLSEKYFKRDVRC